MSDRIYYSKETERVVKRQRIVNALTFTGLGIGLGALFALLFAPDEGEKTREMITDALEEGYRRGREATADALDQFDLEIPNLREKVDGMRDKVSQ
jgi:gas vesicle protein